MKKYSGLILLCHYESKEIHRILSLIKHFPVPLRTGQQSRHPNQGHHRHQHHNPGGGCRGLCRSRAPENLHQEGQDREDRAAEEPRDSQVLRAHQARPAQQMERAHREESRHTGSRCHHRGNLQL